MMSQEMLKDNILSGDLICVCTEHQSDVVDQYLTAHRDVFSLIEQCHNGRDGYKFLEGPACHDKFSRLN